MGYLLKTLLLTLMWSVVACNQHPAPNQTSGQSAPAAAAVKFDNETDFVCGMKVLPEFEDTCHYKGKVYAFCSEDCKKAFAEDPEKYLAGK